MALAFSTVNLLSIAFVCGRAGRSTAQNGFGFWRGQNGKGKDLVFATAEANLVKPLSLSEGLSVLS